MRIRSCLSCRTALVLVAALAFGACAHRVRCTSPAPRAAGTGSAEAPREQTAPPAGEHRRETHHVVVAAPYYRDGVQQARPPEGVLVVGALVEFLEDQGSYVRIRLADGTEAAVEREAIAPLGVNGEAR